MKIRIALAFFAIILLAGFFRFYLIDQMPGGLFPDEAANGLDINLMEQGHLQPFYERGNGREALFFYMLWGSVKVFGRTPLAHHLTSAVVGLLSVVFCYLLTKRLFSLNYSKLEQGLPNLRVAQGIALLATFLMAVSSWHVVLSRTAFRANLIPLFATASFYFLLSVFSAPTKKAKLIWAVLFGLTFGLGFYSYIAYRIIVPILLILGVWILLGDALVRPRMSAFKHYFGYGMLAGIVCLLVLLPLGQYFYTHPGSFVGRSGQVSVFNPELNHGDLPGTILQVTASSFLGYFTHGDLNWRHNISGDPFLSLAVSPFFALGLLLITILAIVYFFRPVKYAQYFKYFLLAGWFYGMLIPVVTTAEGIPHGLRAIGTIPAVFIISAFGGWSFFAYIWKQCQKYIPVTSWKYTASQAGIVLVVVCYVVALPIQTFAQYFIGANHSPEYFYAFRADLTNVSNYLNTYGSKSNTYLILDKFSLQTVDYMTTRDGPNPQNPQNQPYVQVDPEDSWREEGATKDGKLIYSFGLPVGTKIVFTQSSIFDIKKFKSNHPNARLIYEERNKFGQAVLAVYEIWHN